MVQLTVLKVGLDAPEIVDTKRVDELVKIALPHHAEYVAKYGPAAYHYLLDELEMLLLTELQRLLEGSESDAASIAKAAAILKVAGCLMETASEKAATQKAPVGAVAPAPAVEGNGNA